ncbi:MAG: heme A synthase [Candidatus Omnitrophota bacterium]
MNKNIWLRRFSKLTCFSTLVLIFVGGMVTSTGSGLAVPDWPLSYGTLFPPMVGGVFYEHGHRMVASFVGFLMLTLAVWLAFKEERIWVKVCGFWALGAVIVQGLLGGLTVLFYLPTPVSVAHGVLAQTFFLLTIFIAYSQSKERQLRAFVKDGVDPVLQVTGVVLLICIYIQLILGAVMRHTGSGLAVYDFPTIAGSWWPSFNQDMLNNINSWRFDYDLDPVTMVNVFLHLMHRAWAGVIVIGVCVLNVSGLKCQLPNKDKIRNTILCLDGIVFFQIILGIMTILTIKSPVITSLHVVTGAATLGVTFLLLLRIAPLSFKKFSEL